MAQVDQIRRVLRRQPFRPFGLKMVDGTIHTVKHPDWLSVPPIDRPREVAYYQMPDGAPAVPADDYEVHWLDVALISEVIEPAASPAGPKAEGNGD